MIEYEKQLLEKRRVESSTKIIGPIIEKMIANGIIPKLPSYEITWLERPIVIPLPEEAKGADSGVRR